MRGYEPGGGWGLGCGGSAFALTFEMIAAHLVPVLPVIMIGAEEVLGLGLCPPRRTGLPIFLHAFLPLYLSCLQMPSMQVGQERARDAGLGCDMSTRDACIVSGLRQWKRHLLACMQHPARHASLVAVA